MCCKLVAYAALPSQLLILDSWSPDDSNLISIPCICLSLFCCAAEALIYSCVSDWPLNEQRSSLVLLFSGPRKAAAHLRYLG